MSASLTPGQKAQLEAALRLQQHALQAELALQLGEAPDRIQHAREQLLQEREDEEPAHHAERELDLARSDATLQALRAVEAALDRLGEPGFGLCADCGQAIPFDRLRLHPEVSRCTTCQTRHEPRAGRAATL